MPGISGLELAKTIKDAYSNVPVLLASGYSSKQFIPQDQREFPNLKKLYKLDTLAAAVNQLVKSETGWL